MDPSYLKSRFKKKEFVNLLFCGLVAWKCHVCFFFLCEDVKKKVPMCHIYIYLYTCTHTHTHTHSRADLSLLFACESLWGCNASTEPAFARSRSRRRRLAIARPFCSSKPYHDLLHFSISISRYSDARGLVTRGCSPDCCSGRGKTPSLISCRPSALGLELRPHTHYVVYYLNTKALALAPGTRRYHGKQEKHMRWRNVTK